MDDKRYRGMARAVNPYVTWDLTRRKRYTPAERAKIRRAYNAAMELRRAGLQPRRIRRKPAESQSAYTTRLAQIKAQHGETGSPLAAVGLRVSSTEHAVVRGNQVVVRSRKTGRQQWFVAADRARMALDPAAEAQRLFGVARAHGATLVRGALGTRRRGDFAAFDDVADFVEFAVALAMVYRERLAHILVGVYALVPGRAKGRSS